MVERKDMGRPIVEVEIGNLKLNAILDTGSHRSYIKKEIAEKFPVAPVEKFEVKLGGECITITEGRFITGIVKDTEGRSYRFSNVLFPIKELGQENGKEINILFGSVILEDWGAVIDDSVMPPKVDYSILRKGELTEL